MTTKSDAPTATRRIGIIAPGRRLEEEWAVKATSLARQTFGASAPELLFHPQCLESHGHFAGPDEVRLEALVEMANDPAIDAIWIARGGYGACRIAEQAIDRFGLAARKKTWLGYSDAGFLLGGLYARGFRHVAHGPMVADITRIGGDKALRRALNWLNSGDPSATDPAMQSGTAYLAFNLAILSEMLGTPLEPDFTGHVLMIEEVSEHLYAIDRALFHITSSPNVRRASGIMLGRVSDIPENDIPFGEEAEDMVKYWCARAGIPYLGRADIGHDPDNRIVPFGLKL